MISTSYQLPTSREALRFHQLVSGHIRCIFLPSISRTCESPLPQPHSSTYKINHSSPHDYPPPHKMPLILQYENLTLARLRPLFCARSATNFFFGKQNCEFHLKNRWHCRNWPKYCNYILVQNGYFSYPHKGYIS